MDAPYITGGSLSFIKQSQTLQKKRSVRTIIYKTNEKVNKWKSRTDILHKRLRDVYKRQASDREGGEEFCRLILSTLLEREVGKIHINTQKVISAGAPNLRGIRMDVEIIESAGELINVYDIEPCRYHKRGLEKSNRFYQAKICLLYTS